MHSECPIRAFRIVCISRVVYAQHVNSSISNTVYFRSGWQISHLDLAPRYASVLVGITTAVGTLAGIINPIIVGVMTQDQVLYHNNQPHHCGRHDPRPSTLP